MRYFSAIEQMNLLEILDRFTSWLREGLGIFLPAFLRLTGWKTTRIFLDIDDEGNVVDHAIQERSFFGITRINRNVTGSSQNDICPKIINLPDKYVYQTEISLPHAARSDLSTAIRLRLNSISPIPVDVIEYASSEPQEYDNCRLSISVAITKKSHLQKLRAALPHDQRNLLFGYISNEESAYVFKQGNTEDLQQSQRQLRKIIFASTGMALFLWGASVFIERQKESFINHQQTLINEIKTTRQSTEKLSDLIDIIHAQNLTNFSHIASSISDIDAQLPNDIVIETLTYRDGALQVTGFVAENSDSAKQGVAYPYQLGSTNRPGFMTVSKTLRISSDS